MNLVFNHQKLKVYHRALTCCTQLESVVATWDSIHSITDHLPRAAEGILMNIAEASAANTGSKIPLLDSSLGSTLECAACLDIAVIKGLIPAADAAKHKKELLEIFQMLVGLRRSWLPLAVHEEHAVYEVKTQSVVGASGFHHEGLDVYRAALDVVRWFHVCGRSDQLSRSRFRDLDTNITSMVLNIAEGNGRFSASDQCRFVETAHRATIKVAAQLDLCEQRNQVAGDRVENARDLLVRIALMTGALVERLRT